MLSNLNGHAAVDLLVVVGIVLLLVAVFNVWSSRP